MLLQSDTLSDSEPTSLCSVLSGEAANINFHSLWFDLTGGSNQQYHQIKHNMQTEYL